MAITPSRSQQADAATRARDEDRRGATQDIPLWEWIAAAIGLALLVGAVWVLLASAPATGTRPPAFVARIEPAVRVADGWLVRYEAENPGDETMADVRLVATLEQDGRVLETVEAMLDFLPARSARGGGVYFGHDPRAGTVRIRAVSYQAP